MAGINDRVKTLRNGLRLTQKDFGARVLLAQTYLSQIENGERDVTDKIAKIICQEFKVNESWLRTGEGEMFSESASTAIDALCAEYKLGSLEKHILETYCKLSEEKRAVIMDFINDAATVPAPTSAPANADIDIDAEVASYREQLILEKKVKDESFHSDIGSANGAG